MTAHKVNFLERYKAFRVLCNCEKLVTCVTKKESEVP